MVQSTLLNALFRFQRSIDRAPCNPDRSVCTNRGSDGRRFGDNVYMFTRSVNGNRYEKI